GTAAMLCRGHETWHPNPEFYYKSGGGPLLDMGPYYLTALVHLLGPVAEVTGMVATSFKERLITSKPRNGQKISVDVPTHSSAVLKFLSGAVVSLQTSFDVAGTKIPPIEIYGSEGTLQVPDPNTFGGVILWKSRNQSEWKEIPFSHSYHENWRGMGLADMALGMIQGRPHRASGELAFHVLEVMESLSSDQGKKIHIQSQVQKTKPLSLFMQEGLEEQWS
ncbi:MAG: Gfo/Idh/MocA family oxidoreductase, partial [Verrucomicrobiota bacterium]